MTPAPAESDGGAAGAAAVLLAAARAVPPEPAAAAAAMPQSDAAWNLAVALAMRHGVAGLLCRFALAAAASGAASLAEELRGAMETYLQGCAARYRMACDELAEVLGALAAGGVAAAAFKGPAFASLAYAEPALRTSQDLDLLVRPDDAAAALAVLARMGFVSQHPELRPDHRAAYHRYNGQDCLVAPDRAFAVEPHWLLAPRTFAVRLDAGPLLARARPVALADGQAVPTLAPEDALLAACLHGGKEEWTRLVWIADLAALFAAFPGLDGARALAAAEAAGMRRMLLIGAILAADLLGARLPPALQAAASRDSAAQRLAVRAARRLWRTEAAASVFTLTGFRMAARDGIADRVRYGAATLLTARVQHFQAVALPPGWHGLYPLVRIGHDFVLLPLWRVFGGALRRPRGEQVPGSPPP